MAKFKKGEEVRLVSVVPQGAVSAMRMDDDGNVQYKIVWTDVQGVSQERWFNEGQLEAVV